MLTNVESRNLFELWGQRPGQEWLGRREVDSLCRREKSPYFFLTSCTREQGARPDITQKTFFAPVSRHDLPFFCSRFQETWSARPGCLPAELSHEIIKGFSHWVTRGRFLG